MKYEQELIDIWFDFCKEQKLPHVSADEIAEGLTGKPSKEQKEFAKSYCAIWSYFQYDYEEQKGGSNNYEYIYY